MNNSKRTLLKRILLGVLAVVVVALLVGAFLFWRTTVPARPTAFYTPPDPLPAGAPGTIIRAEEFTDHVPEGARAWRVLYLSQGADGQPVAVSGIVAAPAAPSDEPRPVVAWAHGTLGIMPECGPGHTDDPFATIPEVPRLLQQGFVLTATDYPGLGTPGVHPYLFGRVEAAAVLDSVRAAQQLDTGAGDRFAVWGHSQGGHSTLWTAMIAGEYAPELELVGAVATSPPVDLAAVLEQSMDRQFGSILLAMALKSWEANTPGADLAALVSPEGVAEVNKLAGVCLLKPNAVLLLGKLKTPAEFLPADLARLGPLQTFIEANAPTGPIDAPLLIVHGTTDEVIPFEGSAAEAARRCANGEDVELDRYPGDGHWPVVANSAVRVVGWIEDRFAGRPTGSTCGD